MPASHATIYLIAGCNGAGKTTFAKEFLPNEVKCLRSSMQTKSRAAYRHSIRLQVGSKRVGCC